MNLRQPKLSASYKEGVAKISYSPFTAIVEKSHPPFMKEGERGVAMLRWWFCMKIKRVNIDSNQF